MDSDDDSLGESLEQEFLLDQAADNWNVTEEALSSVLQLIQAVSCAIAITR